MPLIRIGAVELRTIPAEAVDLPSAKREISEVVTLDGRVIATRPARSGSQTLSIISPANYVITEAQALELEALASVAQGFGVTITGFGSIDGEYPNCTFSEPPTFRKIGNWRRYNIVIYIPQHA